MKSTQTQASQEKKLREMLKNLKEKHGLVAMKLGTEAEACRFEYIAYINKLAQQIVPVLVKIGGPDARNDIRTLLKMRIGGIIAPIVESPYGLKKYVRTVREVAGEENFKILFKGIMIETLSAFNQMSKMLETPEVKMIDHITIGRGDLSKSIGKRVDDQETIEKCKEITRWAHAASLTVSVAGGITPLNAKQIASKIKSDEITTGYLVFNIKESSNISESIKKGLEFEVALLSDSKRRLKRQLMTVRSRLKTLHKRMIS